MRGAFLLVQIFTEGYHICTGPFSCSATAVLSWASADSKCHDECFGLGLQATGGAVGTVGISPCPGGKQAMTSRALTRTC